MNPSFGHIRKIYFLGIGGIGMSALARYFRRKGLSIQGYDKTPTTLTRQLEAEGMVIHYSDDISLIPPDIDLIVYTPAVPESLNEYEFLASSGIRMIKRALAVGELTEGRTTVAVAGTHGKTSISSLIAHILMEAGRPVTALIGGIARNYDSNLVTSGKEEIMVVEADEYDRSFLHLHPDIAVISAIDADHLDIYGSTGSLQQSFSEFAAHIKPGGMLALREGIEVDLKSTFETVTYSVEGNADISALNPVIREGRQRLDMSLNGRMVRDVALRIPGRHNVENAMAAAAVCVKLGVSPEQIAAAVSTFTGVTRRYDVRLDEPGPVYIDDYAHHPRELEAFISAVRMMYPGKKLTGMFQPHLYSRTRDLADGFAQSLDLLDEAWLLDIYPARELPIPGVSSEMILEKMKLPHKKIVSREQALQSLTEKRPEIFLTIGAGDIDLLVGKIEKILRA